MNNLVGRNTEIALLKDALVSAGSELIAVYGRRRIGKTFLIRQVYAEVIQFEFSGLYKGNIHDQLENFSSQLIKRSGSRKKLKRPQTWLEGFDLLSQYIDSIKSKKKKVIFIDEFPWLDTPRSKFLMAFGNFWNDYVSKRNDIVVVICGSAASYMVQEIVNNKGGLHNRISQKIRLLPFTLYETELFLKQKHILFSKYDILQLYMAIGGIPYYLEKLKKGESVAQALDRLCFAKDGILINEFNIVFSSLYDNSENHISIVKALSRVRKGLTRNDLAKKSKILTGGTLTNTIHELIESGFVSHYLPFEKKSKDALYRLTDEYSMFYLKFIDGSKSLGAGTWKKMFNQRSFSSWSGFSFETVCLKHIQQIKVGLGIDRIYSEESSWTESGMEGGAQIDLLIYRGDNIINVCEMKFSMAEFTITRKYADELRDKVNTFRNKTKSRKNIFITMLTTYGIKENSYSLQLVQNSLTMDCLFV